MPPRTPAWQARGSLQGALVAAMPLCGAGHRFLWPANADDEKRSSAPPNPWNRPVQSFLGGGPERSAKQHAEGKLTARERLTSLLDKDSFQEMGLFAQHRATLFGMADKPLPADGVVTGSGTIEGRTVHVASQDFTVAGGSAGEVHGYKIADTMKYSLNTGSPSLLLHDSGGAR